MDWLQGFRKASSERQIVIGAIVAVILCALLLGGYFLVLRKPYGVLFSNLRTQDAATIVADLDKKKTPYRIEDGGATIRVPQDKVDATRLAIMSEDLPLKGTVGFELFNKSDMGLTEFAQRINYQRALQGELARTIMTMDSVDTARIHLSLAEPTLFRDDQRPPKASVEVLPRPGGQIAPETVRGIQRLVAAAVPDLSPADVVVLDQGGRVVSGESGVASTAVGVAPSADLSPEAQQWRSVESYYAARIRRSLLKLYPNGDTQVGVSALVGAVTKNGDAGSTLDAWSAGSRAFALRAVISPPTPASPDVQAQIQAIAAQAVGLNPSLGDAITIASPGQNGAVAPTVFPGASPDRPSPLTRPSRVTQAGPPPSALWLLLLVPLFALMVWGALTLDRRRRSNGLPEAKQRAFAERFETLLEEGDARAASNP